MAIVNDRQVIKQLQKGIKKTFGLWDYAPKDGASVRCLCPRCVDSYRNAGKFIVRRLDPFQKAKDICDRCNRSGWDYVVIDRGSPK